ncbi:hypothetical protein B0H10DRAFT_2016134 [Mycena sp. CBHHK59/15]|nr:hypothetical protein B0H10DRAFT_2016134 [Mycena sp. CBHHK59/15]
MSPPAPTSLKSCNNPDCRYFGVLNRDSVRECSGCKTATYCNKDCQRAHWPVHKTICLVWKESATNNGETVKKLKKRMGEFIWLIRGVSNYTDDLFKQYIASRREGRSGCMEFLFETSEELDDAIRVIESLPVLKKRVFRTMPSAPGHQEMPDGIPVTMRKLTAKREHAFTAAVDTKMAFTDSDRETRPNLINLLNLVGSSERMLVVCVTMMLEGMSSTHSYDFLYKDLSWRPEDSATRSNPDRLAIEGPDDSPALRRKISIDVD